MRNLASRSKIEAEAVIKYIIDGITDDVSNKIILYGAKNFQDFKEEIKIYPSIRAKFNLSTSLVSVKNKSTSRWIDTEGAQRRCNEKCYSCGEKDILLINFHQKNRVSKAL